MEALSFALLLLYFFAGKRAEPIRKRPAFRGGSVLPLAPVQFGHAKGSQRCVAALLFSFHFLALLSKKMGQKGICLRTEGGLSQDAKLYAFAANLVHTRFSEMRKFRNSLLYKHIKRCIYNIKQMVHNMCVRGANINNF